MKKIILGATLILSCGMFTANAKNVLDLKHSIEDSSIVYPESFSTDTQKLLENWYLKNYTTIDTYTETEDVPVTQETVAKRLASLNNLIEMPVNPIVMNYIERYTKSGRRGVSEMLGLSVYYMPIFEAALDKAGLPLELKYLPVIESSLNPAAVSSSGATGLWQITIGTGRGLDMEISSLVDERCDPYVSSEKACSYLRDLYNIFGDWSLTIAAYNCGPGTVNKALTRAGGDANSKDYWTIYEYLPEETRGYVPAFIAANYVMNFYDKHNIAPVLATKPLVTDKLPISDRLHLNQICEVLEIPIEEVRILNPQFKQDIIPGSEDKQYNLILPMQQIQAYLVSEQQIHDYDREKYAQRLYVNPGDEVAYIEQNVAEGDYEPLNPADFAPAEEVVADIWAETEESVSSTEPSAVKRPRRNNNQTTPAETSAPVASSTPVRPKTTTPSVQETAPVSTSTPVRTKTPANDTSTQSKARNKNTQKEVAAANAPAPKAKAKAKAQETAAVKDTKKGNDNKKADNKKDNNKKDNKKADNKKDDKKPAKKEAAPKPTNHTVTNGESLEKIAKKNGITVAELKKANPGVKETIHPGDKLTIPAKGKATAKADTKADNKKDNKKDNNKKDNKKADNKKDDKKPAKKQTASKPSSHTVANGESMERIAKKNGVSVEALKKANPGVKDPNKIKPGDQIKIPKK